MQTPEIDPQIPPHMSAQPPGGAPKSKCGLMAALGCGIPVVILILLIVLASITGGSKTASNSATPNKGSTQKGGEEDVTKTALPRYVGQWTGADGTSIWIRGDGKADFNSGNTKVSGGGVTIDESNQKLAITSFFGIGKTWKLDAAPKDKDGQTEMTLNGIIYRRTGGFDAGQGTSPTGFDENAVPPLAEQKRLIKQTMISFDQALGTKDFTSFYNQSSEAWRKQTTPTELREVFKGFIDKKIRLTKTIEIYPASIKTAKVEDSLLTLKGTYGSNPKTHFELIYIPEDNTWKLSSIHVKIGSPITD